MIKSMSKTERKTMIIKECVLLILRISNILKFLKNMTLDNKAIFEDV